MDAGADGLHQINPTGALGQAQQGKETLQRNLQNLASMAGGYQSNHILEELMFAQSQHHAVCEMY